MPSGGTRPAVIGVPPALLPHLRAALRALAAVAAAARGGAADAPPAPCAASSGNRQRRRPAACGAWADTRSLAQGLAVRVPRGAGAPCARPVLVFGSAPWVSPSPQCQSVFRPASHAHAPRSARGGSPPALREATRPMWRRTSSSNGTGRNKTGQFSRGLFLASGSSRVDLAPLQDDKRGLRPTQSP